MTDFPIELDLPRPILVLGGYGYRNAGDEAMLAGLLELLGRDELTVVSRRPADTASRHRVRAVGLAAAIGALANHRSIVIGGGGLFGRDMGRLGRLLPGFALTAYALGREIVLLGIGIDRRPTGSVAALARRATRVVVRDRRSVDLFAEADVRAELAPDLSTLMPSIGRASGRRALRAVGVDPTRRILGLCLTSMHGELDAGLQAAVLALVDARPDLQPLLIPMSRHPFVAAHDDERLARRLAERRPTLRVLDTDDPATILSVFATLDVALCMRYHALQFADRAGVPIVAIPYAPKCDAWLAERGLAATPANAEALTLAVDAIVPRPADRAIREGAAA